MTDPIRIVVPLATPSLNQTQRMHWAKRRELATAWGLLMLRSLGSKPPPATTATGATTPAPLLPR